MSHAGLFQHTATRRWLHGWNRMGSITFLFQHTATRRWLLIHSARPLRVGCFNTQPPEGGCLFIAQGLCGLGVSTHSHPKVAAQVGWHKSISNTVSTHSHPKVAAAVSEEQVHEYLFQHTATRRWLQFGVFAGGFVHTVSTHSHPKVAALSSCTQNTD